MHGRFRGVHTSFYQFSMSPLHLLPAATLSERQPGIPSFQSQSHIKPLRVLSPTFAASYFSQNCRRGSFETALWILPFAQIQAIICSFIFLSLETGEPFSLSKTSLPKGFTSCILLPSPYRNSTRLPTATSADLISGEIIRSLWRKKRAKVASKGLQQKRLLYPP